MAPASAKKFSKSKKPKAMQKIEKAGKDLLSSRANVNNAPLLIKIVASAVDNTSASEEALEALVYLQSFFVPLFKTELSSTAVMDAASRLKRKRSDEKEQHDVLQEDAEAIYRNWLKSNYVELRDILKKIIFSPSPASTLKVAALDALMEFIRQEKQGNFQNSIYSRLLASLVSSKELDDVVLNLLVSKYFMYKDVRYYSYSNLAKIIENFSNNYQGRNTLIDSEDGEKTNNSSSLFVGNVLEILLQLPPPEENAQELWTVNNGINKSKSTTKPGKDEQPYDGKFSVKSTRAKLSKAWLAFLRLPLTVDVYKRVLATLHKSVMPYLTNPILLSDFLTRSYDIGGVISVMALNSLFILMMQYGLEYPDFYNKLYALLEPSIFMARYRSRFFELLDTCLKSPLLPAYLAAAFAKKLSRLSLSVPPSGALIVIAIIHNLLRRHPSINCLVQEVVEEDGTAISIEHEQNTENKSPSLKGVDYFNSEEKDTAKCKALQSSLWEIETLRRHYCPPVSRFVASIENDLTVRVKTSEVAVKDFSSGSYGTIFAEEVGRRIKQVPVAFYKSVPSTLFPSKRTEKGDSVSDFSGWNFTPAQ